MLIGVFDDAVIHSMTRCVEGVLCLVQSAVHSSGRAPASNPPAEAGCYANESLVGVRGFDTEPTLERLCRPSGLCDLLMEKIRSIVLLTQEVYPKSS
ncbi:jg9565, partial [Pararge aegeria aegeria]